MDILSWAVFFIAVALIAGGITLRFFPPKFQSETTIANTIEAPVLIKEVKSSINTGYHALEEYILSLLNSSRYSKTETNGVYNFYELTEFLKKKYDTTVQAMDSRPSGRDTDKNIVAVYKVVVSAEQKHHIILTMESYDTKVRNLTFYTHPDQDLKIDQLVAELSVLSTLDDEVFAYKKTIYGTEIEMNRKYIDLEFPNAYKKGKTSPTDIEQLSKEFNSYRDIGGVGTLITGTSRTGKSVLCEALLIRAFSNNTQIIQMPNKDIHDSIRTVRRMINESKKSNFILDFGQLSEQYFTSNQQTPTVATLLEFVSEWAFTNKKVSWIAASNTNHEDMPEAWRGRFNNVIEMKPLTENQIDKLMRKTVNPAYKITTVPAGEYTYSDIYKFIKLKDA